MNTIENLNFFLFTGGPGAGKSTVLDELSRQGLSVVPEVARAIIKEQHAIGGNATHNGNRTIYCDLMLMKSIEDYIQNSTLNEIVFFDRGIPDLYSYSNRFCGGVDSAIQDAVNHFRYNPQVFLFPPWPEIYCHDTERKQDYQEAIDTYHAVKEGYNACGYSVIEVPKCSIKARADFILKSIGQPKQGNTN